MAPKASTLLIAAGAISAGVALYRYLKLRSSYNKDDKFEKMSEEQWAELQNLQVELDNDDFSSHTPEGRWTPATEEDLVQIKRLLQRVPEGLLGVAHYNSKTGEPSVLAVRPYVRGQPFPTTYWMCDSLLRAKISELEIAGVTKDIELNVIPSDAAFAQRLMQDNLRYIRNRWQLLSREDFASMKEGPLRTLRQRGIGGILDFRFVRCLHMQYAYHLAHLAEGGTAVGHYLDEQFGMRENA